VKGNGTQHIPAKHTIRLLCTVATILLQNHWWRSYVHRRLVCTCVLAAGVQCLTNDFGNAPRKMLKLFHYFGNAAAAVFKVNASDQSVWQISAALASIAIPGPEFRGTVSRLLESCNSFTPLTDFGILHIRVRYLAVGCSPNHDFTSFSSLSARCIHGVPSSPKQH
jgi:hypothetical protein